MVSATYTPAEAAKLLRVSRSRLMGWIRSGKLVASNLGDGAAPRYRLTAEAVADFLERRRVQPPPSKAKHARITRRTTQEYF